MERELPNEALDEIQRRALESFRRRNLDKLIRRAGLTGSIRGGTRSHPDIARTALIVGGLIATLLAGVSLVKSNMGGIKGLEERVDLMANRPMPVFER